MKTRMLAVLLSALFSATAFAAATDAAKGSKPGAARIKKIRTQYSPLTGNIATIAVNPVLIAPDLVPYVGSFLSSCS